MAAIRTAHILGLVLFGLAAAAAPAATAAERAGAGGDPAALAQSLAQLVLTRSPVILGEIHGTAEVPALVGDVLAAVLEHGGPVQLALEIPSSHQAGLDRYLASAGTDADRQALFRHRFWGFRDGRSSVAMLGLLDRVRILRADGHALTVLAFDVAEPGDPAREATLAATLGTALRRPGRAPALVLTGNLHARKAIGTPFDPTLELMAWRLRDLEPLSIDIRAPTGSAWVCAPDCGVLQLGAGRAAGRPALRLFDAPSATGYDGEVQLARFTASPPASEANDQIDVDTEAGATD